MLLLFKFKVTFEAKNTGGAIGKLDFEEMWAHGRFLQSKGT